MKKNSLLFASLILFTSFSAFSCGGSEEPPVVEYKVSYEESKYYTFDGLEEKYEVNSFVTFSLDLNTNLKTLVNVKANDDIIEAEYGFYKFTMPEQDVVITVTLEDKEPFTTNINFPSEEITIDKSNSSLTYDFEMYLNFNHCTMMDIETEVADESVLPKDSFTVKEICQNQSNLIIGATLSFNSELINTGTTYLYLKLTNKNISPAQEASFIKKVVIS